MRINIEASTEELAEIIANGINIGDLPCEIIAALDDNFSLPGYNVTVNEPSAIQAQLVEALKGLDDSFCSINEFSTKEERHQARMNLIAARAAVSAAEVQP